MEPIELSNEELSETDAEDLPSVDEFIKQLEEREKDLDISSDLVIEVGESEFEHDNIHDSFVSLPEIDLGQKAGGPASGASNGGPSESKSSTHDDKEYEKVVLERDDFRDSLKRQKRDFDNYRQRTERERTEMFKNMIGSLAKQMLPVLDNLNRALDATSRTGEEPKPQDMNVFLEGIVLVNQQLNEVLAGMGVQPIPAVGEPFDPNIHEAVATEESDEHPPK
ncbi:MAG: nucleotide exchange factor GrpE, partial [Acidobacteriota bacterium]|nr:nucleotide exchange factor GrpE [Acidobacteriota bacterium]